MSPLVVKKVPRFHALPEWLVRGTDPVPLTDSFRSQAVATRVHAFLISLIDGRRSISPRAKNGREIANFRPIVGSV